MSGRVTTFALLSLAYFGYIYFIIVIWEAVPVVGGSSQARDRICATAVTMPDP